MNKGLFIGIAFLLFCPILSAQELYIPRDVKQAYKNETRSLSGKPGSNYWQNKGKYSIQLTINPPDRTVHGVEKITYTNNSPDTLKMLNFKLILNDHKPEAPRNRAVSKDYLTSGVHVDSYSENGKTRKFKSSNTINKYIKLAQPLLPNDSIHLSFKWHFSLSKQSGREGAIDSTTFFLAYFYPRVAVYDDYEGWDFTQVQGSIEFYNDFNDYTFQVTVPKNYIVWATGDLLNPDAVLQKKYAKRLKKSMTSDEVIKVANQNELKKHQVTKQQTNTWKWKANNVTDVAIAISNHYNWDAGSVVVDSLTGRRASVQSAYDEKSKDFKKMVSYGKHALNWFSNNYPGISYPYSKSTIVRGFADMEYPMMVNDNSNSDAYFTRFVVEHEIAHTYFPFYMGTNETRFAFMDEGWATTFEYLIGINDLGHKKATTFFKTFRVNQWIHNKSMASDIPIIIPSNLLRGVAYGDNAYGKAALGYLAVKDLLGDKLFKKSLQGYMKWWNGKHPIPWDFFNAMSTFSGKNLNWFWKRWYFSHDYIDLGIKKVVQKGNGIDLTLINTGGMPAPVDVIVQLKNGTTKKFHQTPIIWKANAKETVVHLDDVKDVEKVTLDGEIWMDANLSDNHWEK